MSSEARPRAREGLLASDHSKRGRRFVILVDPETRAATLLEPWEHAVLVLCDGTRPPGVLVELLAPEVEGQPIDLEVVRRCLKFFERQGLITKVGLRLSDAPPPGPVTVNELQRAYAEWHKVPGDEAVAGVPPPIPRTSPKIAPGLGPTVSVGAPGKSILTGVHSLLDAAAPADRPGDDDEDSASMPDLLAALDDAVAEASRVDQSERALKVKRRGVEVAEAESRPRTSGVFAPPAGGVMVAPELAEEGAVVQAKVVTEDLPVVPPPEATPSSRPRPQGAPPPTRIGPPASRPAAPAASLPPAPLPPGVPPRKIVKAAAAPAPAEVRPASPAPRPIGVSTEPTVRLADLLGTDATEPATILLQPQSPGVRLRDEDAISADTQRLVKRSTDAPTQLGSLVKKRPQ